MFEGRVNFMKKMKLALIAAVVGAISMAPTQLLPAAAAILGSATSASQTVSSGTFGAVAGASSAATTASAFAVTSMTSSCSVSQSTRPNPSPTTPSGSSTIILVSVGSLAVGMIISTTTGIVAGTKVTAINTGTNTITITPNTNAVIPRSTSLTFSGCYQAYFNVNNIRSIALASFQISQAVTTTAPDGITLQSCSLIWTEATGACSGTITNIVVTNSGTSAFTTVSGALAATTGTVRLRALCNTSAQTSTISINIATTNVRATVTTNS